MHLGQQVTGCVSKNFAIISALPAEVKVVVLCVTVVPVPTVVKLVPVAVIETFLPEVCDADDNTLDSVPVVTVVEPEAVALVGGVIVGVMVLLDRAGVGIMVLVGGPRGETEVLAVEVLLTSNTAIFPSSMLFSAFPQVIGPRL